MIKKTAMLVRELEQKGYANPLAKIRRLVRAGDLTPIVRGLYETDSRVPGHYLAPAVYGPSYLSFEFALAYYSLIPEAVHSFTSATFEKKRTKQYLTPYGTYSYRDVPSEVYPLGLVLCNENGYGFQIATPEKALCDQLYKLSPVRNGNELEHLLFEDLRIDEQLFFGLNTESLLALSGRYHTHSHKLLQAYLRRRIRHGSGN